MSGMEATLDRIAAERAHDPLMPLTVIVPSRLALLQLRRRLAQRGPFANVRFDVIARLAELVAAPELARAGRRPLARPIGDYATWLVARESRGRLASVAELDGYARALRQTFRRLRRGGFARAEDIPSVSSPSQLSEIARLFGRFRTLTSAFYDEDDLLDTAAATLRKQRERSPIDLGAVYVVPPVRLSAGSAAFLDAIAEVAPKYEEVEKETGAPVERFIMAPDPASEARCVAREVVGALREGVPLQQIAVLYGGDQSYRSLLGQTFASASIPVAIMPGTPLNETAVGRGVLSLASLPLTDYSRAALFDFLSLAPLRAWVPTRQSGAVRLQATQWQRIAREAGITHGLERWRDGLELFGADREAGLAPGTELSDARRRLFEADLDAARNLAAVVQHLARNLEPLRERQRAGSFISIFLNILDTYMRRDAQGMLEVRAEVEQLGTVDSIGGDFDLASFVEALRANLSIAAFRERSLGDGILVSDYRLAAGLRFQRIFVCGTYEGAFPAASEAEPLLQDDVWTALRAHHPFVDNLERHLELANAAAARILEVAARGTLTWSCPLQAANARRDYYPSAPVVAAAGRREPAIHTATDLRRATARDWLIRPPSPLAAMLGGGVVDQWESRLRETIVARRGETPLAESHPLQSQLTLLRSRRGATFSSFDGNLYALHGLAAPPPGASVSPTSLQDFAICGFRYFLGSVLRLRGVAEPEESATISAAERGTLVHRTLERFFRYQFEHGRPTPGERWSSADVDLLLSMFDEEFVHIQRLGRAGLDLYAGFERRLMRADLAAFLDKDSDFRIDNGVVPTDFELRVPPTPLGEVNLTGFVDRIDRTPDGSEAFVIDYKTGKSDDYEKATEDDPFVGGRFLQLPVYVLAASGAERVQALYWFVSSRAEFKHVRYEETESSRERFMQTIGAILRGIRAGAFPAVPGVEDDYYGSFQNCRYCAFDRLCTRRRVYELQEKQGDADMQPWHQVSMTARGDALA